LGNLGIGMSKSPILQITKSLLPILLIALMISSQAIAAFPQQINYQGKLTNASNIPLTGSYSILFGIYDVSSGGSALWSETQTVTTESGFFNVLLGSVDPISTEVFTGNDRWLGIKVGSDSEMTPRQKLTSVGHAFYAYNADKLDGQDGSYYAPASGGDYVLKTGDTMTGTLTNSASVYVSDKVGIGNAANAYAKLEVWRGTEAYTIVGSYSGITDVGLLGASDAGARGLSSNSSGYGVDGENTSTTGAAIGVRGRSGSPTGRGVYGWAEEANGVNYGVYAQTNSPNGYALYAAGGRNYFEGKVGIGTTSPGALLDIAGKATIEADGDITTSAQFKTTVASGTPPLTVVSTTAVTNLNADLLDGQHASEFVSSSVLDGYVQLGPATQQTTTAATAVWVKGDNYGVSAEGGSGSTDIGIYGSAYTGVYGIGTKYGVEGRGAGAGSTAGVYGVDSTGSNIGHLGKSDRGVYGKGSSYGVYGEYDASNFGTLGENGYGVRGVGTTRGVSGASSSSSGIGVFGTATATTGANTGGRFETASDAGTAVNARAGSTTGTNYAIYAETKSSDGYAGYFKGGKGVSVEGNVTADQFISTIADGTAPLTVASTTVVTNLNADKLDGHDWSEVPSSTGFVLLGPATRQTTTAAQAVWVSGATNGISAEGGEYGVYGKGVDSGVYGVSSAVDAVGVTGVGTWGVMGLTTPDKGSLFMSGTYGVVGSGNTGVYGSGVANGVYGKGNYGGVYGTGESYGVYGTINGTHYGILGATAKGINVGVYGGDESELLIVGNAPDAVGVIGATSTYGVYGSDGTRIGILADGYEGVYGWNNSSSAEGWLASATEGVHGYINKASGYAVYAEQGNASGYALYATGGKNYMSGQLTVANTIESSSGGYKFPDGTTQTSAISSTNYVQLGPATMQTTTAAVAIYVSGASGIYGIADTSGNGNVGIGGVTYQALGSGVFGNAFSTSVNMHYGGYFQASGEAGFAVYGRARSTSGTNYGVYGETKSTTNGYGVYSKGRIGTDSQIVSTLSTGTAPLSVESNTLCTNLNADLLDDKHASEFAAASPSGAYVQLDPPSQQATTGATAVWVSGASTGVHGEGTTYGVYGINGSNYGYLGGGIYGVFGRGTIGIWGYNGDASKSGYLGGSEAGVYGQSSATNGYLGGDSFGVFGQKGTTQGYIASADNGVFGVTESPSGWGGYFTGGYGLYGSLIKTADGGADAPSYTFNDETDVGMYRVNTDQIGFATGGANRLTITDIKITSAVTIEPVTDSVGQLGTTNTYGGAQRRWARVCAVDTTIRAADVNEKYLMSQPVEDGDVVFISGDNTMSKCSRPYDPKAAGVVKKTGGLTMDDDLEGGVPVALLGKVPCKVSIENGAIKPGDPLTASSTPGHAMKATQPGTIVGKALQAFDGSSGKTGKIMVLVNVSWFGGETPIAMVNY
jgi:hypothetical protein